MTEEALIAAVSGYSELYKISSSDYHYLFLKKEPGEIISIIASWLKSASRDPCILRCTFKKTIPERLVN